MKRLQTLNFKLNLHIVSFDIEESKEGLKFRQFLLKNLESLGFRRIQLSVMAALLDENKEKILKNFLHKLESFKKKIWFTVVNLKVGSWSSIFENNTAYLLYEVCNLKERVRLHQLREVAKNNFKVLRF